MNAQERCLKINKEKGIKHTGCLMKRSFLCLDFLKNYTLGLLRLSRETLIHNISLTRLTMRYLDVGETIIMSLLLV